jgi:hypothetical protein
MYRKGVLENGKRKAMRIWLGADVLFAPGPDGTEVLTDEGARPCRVGDGDLSEVSALESARHRRIFHAGNHRRPSTAPRGCVLASFANTSWGVISSCRRARDPSRSAIQAKESPTGDRWNGVAITLFLTREALQFADPRAKTQ